MLDKEIIDYFRESGFAVIIAKLDLGEGTEAIVLVKSTKELLDGLKSSKAVPAVGFITEKTEAGPVVCLALACEAPSVGELLGEAYLDIFEEGDEELLKMMAAQPRLRVAMYDEELSLAYLTQTPWGEISRLSAEQALDRASELAEKTKNPDFDRALDLFQSKVPVEAIAAAARGGLYAD